MLEDYYVKPSTIDRVRASWLAPQMESYLEWLQAHGYSRLVVYRRLPLLFHFAEFAQKKGCKDVSSCKVYIKEFVSQWLEQHEVKTKTAVAIRKHTIDAECGVRQMLQLACKEPVTRNRRRGPLPFESAVPGFAEYLRSERGFAESTIRNYRRHLSEFAQYLSQTGVTSFSQLSPPVLAAFVVQPRRKWLRARASVSAVICESCCGSVTARESRVGISAEQWELHRYIGSAMCHVPSPGMKSAACWKQWSEERFEDGGTTLFCFFWSPMACEPMRSQG
jgi:hypothetical protein